MTYRHKTIINIWGVEKNMTITTPLNPPTLIYSFFHKLLYLFIGRKLITHNIFYLFAYFLPFTLPLENIW